MKDTTSTLENSSCGRAWLSMTTRCDACGELHSPDPMTQRPWQKAELAKAGIAHVLCETCAEQLPGRLLARLVQQVVRRENPRYET